MNCVNAKATLPVLRAVEAATIFYAPLSGGARYRPINWGEFRAQRSAGDYADLGSEIQISDYLVVEQ